MRELTLVFPPIETYQGSAFVLGIFLAYSDYEDLQYNGYINLQYRKGAPNLGWLAPFLIKTMPQDDPVYKFLDKKRSQGKPYYVYMTAGANKFLRIYYGRVKEYLSSLPESE